MQRGKDTLQLMLGKLDTCRKMKPDHLLTLTVHKNELKMFMKDLTVKLDTIKLPEKEHKQ